MRIGIACYPSIGGSGIVATQLGHALDEKGHEIHFFSFDVPVRLIKCRCGCRFHHVDVPSYPVLTFPPYTMALASRVYQVACRAGLDVLHVHYAIPHSTSAILVKQMLEKAEKKIAVVTTLHGTDSYLVGIEPSYRSIVEFCLEECDAITAVSEHLKNETYQNFSIQKDIEVIYNFVALENFHTSEKVGGNSHPKTIIHVSNFRSLKRVGDALKVFELVSHAMPARLVLVGEGPEMPATRDMVDKLGLTPNVDFIGATPNVEPYIASADVLISNSEIESFGLAIAEAMALGVPVVATRVGGVPEVVADGTTGILCDLGDISAMVCAVLRILTDETLAERFSSEAKDRVRERFSPQVIVPQYEALYQRLVGD